MFTPKSSWKSPGGHPNLEVFLSQTEHEIFKTCEKPLGYLNHSRGEWRVVSSLADNRKMFIKKADKGSCVVAWGRSGYVMAAEKQLNDGKVYKNTSDSKHLIPKLTEKSNKIFKSLKRRCFISEKQLKYLRCDFKKACILDKLCLLPKIHNRIFNVPGRLVISNCGTPTEKVSEFLDSHLQPIMRKGLSCVQKHVKRIDSVPEKTILVTADVVGLYPNIPHDVGLKALEQAFDKQEQKKIPTEHLLNMAEFVLKSNILGYNDNIKQQISGAAIGTKCALTYECIFMDELERDFLLTQDYQPFLWFRYIDDIFIIWTHGEKKQQTFLVKLNKFHPNIKFTCESSKEIISFLDLNVKLSEGELETDLYIKPTDGHQYLRYSFSHPEHT